jgi:hypothetical protein
MEIFQASQRVALYRDGEIDGLGCAPFPLLSETQALSTMMSMQSEEVLLWAALLSEILMNH